MDFQVNLTGVEISHSLNPVGILEILNKVKWAIKLNIYEEKLAIWKISSAHSDCSYDSWATDQAIWTYREIIIHTPSCRRRRDSSNLLMAHGLLVCIWDDKEEITLLLFVDDILSYLRKFKRIYIIIYIIIYR